MLDVFTKPEGEEGLKGPILGILAGVFLGSGFWVLSETFELFSPMWSRVGGIVVFVIVTYQVRLAFVKKPAQPEDQPEEGSESDK